MACSNCRRNGLTQISKSVEQLQGVSVPELQGSDFQRMRYIGESGTIPTIVRNINYGYHKQNSILMVHTKDIQENEELFQSVPSKSSSLETSESSNVGSRSKRRTSKTKKTDRDS